MPITSAWRFGDRQGSQCASRRRVWLGILGTCLPVLCEIEAGMRQVRQQAKYRRDLDHLLLQLKLWPIDRETARLYGDLHQELRRRGRVLSQVDIMVAALARQFQLTLLTTDRDFEALPDLPTADWSKSE